ncbi:double-cubane-cluster-containing anaerobic reductase [Desulfobulbus oligotrophicus]|uniref:2-hydroxyacyl-CoA dehydratase n=1 Tax=Desulfobulbus oligotrophicus TaxID=1909699 RepID=A0A7T5VAQ0_9BACT|nr:double-cubane-cluster-containing anaerobic reductase [Desulfobulbus oligotrophicus]QQG64411.1 2-hydroxyacyl-CoA dehydratase [Desulfobulbus oligotrophicus]
MKCASYEAIGTAFEQNVLRLNEAKAAGKKVVGQFCLYTPSEISLAAGAIPVSLCGTKNDSIPAAEEFLPRALCPLIKSSFGFGVKDSCAYLAASDLVVADTTCDGKKKMYELFDFKPLFMLQLPQIQDDDALAYWRKQFQKLVEHLEKTFNVTITEEKLKQAIRLMNRERLALKAVMDLAQRKPSPITGQEMVEIYFKTSFFPDKEVGIKMLQNLADELGAMDIETETGKESAPRILITGVPIGVGSHKVVKLVEECGGAVVCLDNCSGYKKTRMLVDENAEPLSALAERYLQVPCAVMSPNPFRYDAITEMVKDFSVDAVLDLTWQGCQTYTVESSSLKKYVQNSLKLPFLQIETDYSETDTEQLKVRIEAFLEML